MYFLGRMLLFQACTKYLLSMLTQKASQLIYFKMVNQLIKQKLKV